MMDLFSYPARPGFKRTDTSLEAADSMAPKASRLREMVRAAIADAGAAGLTTEEIVVATRIPYSSAQPRTSELRATLQIKDSGARRLNASGKRAIVWVLA